MAGAWKRRSLLLIGALLLGGNYDAAAQLMERPRRRQRQHALSISTGHCTVSGGRSAVSSSSSLPLVATATTKQQAGESNRSGRLCNMETAVVAHVYNQLAARPHNDALAQRLLHPHTTTATPHNDRKIGLVTLVLRVLVQVGLAAVLTAWLLPNQSIIPVLSTELVQSVRAIGSLIWLPWLWIRPSSWRTDIVRYVPAAAAMIMPTSSPVWYDYFQTTVLPQTARTLGTFVAMEMWNQVWALTWPHVTDYGRLLVPSSIIADSDRGFDSGWYASLHRTVMSILERGTKKLVQAAMQKQAKFSYDLIWQHAYQSIQDIFPAVNSGTQKMLKKSSSTR